MSSFGTSSSTASPSSSVRHNKVAPMEINCAQLDKHQLEEGSRSRGFSLSGRKIERDRGLSYPATLLNFLKSLVGAGFLSLPLAFRDAGLWSAFILLVMFAFLNCFCMMQLVKCAQHHYKRLNIPYLNYGNVARETCAVSFQCVRSYGNIAKLIVNTAVLSLQFGFCSTYYLFIAVSLREIFDEFTDFHRSTTQWLMLIFVPMVLLNFIRTLRVLAFFSALGNALMMSSLGFTLYYLIMNPRHSVSELPFYNGFDGLLTASGTIIYSYEAQTLVLPLENKLKRPRQMLGPFGILSSGIFISSLIYGSMGFFGYVAYGHEVKGSITLNLPEHQVSFTLVKLALCLSIFTCFLLQMYVVVEMLWSRISRVIIAGESKQKKKGYKKGGEEEEEEPWWRLPASYKFGTELLLRVLLVTVCFTFAFAVPNLERIIPLVGITSGMLLSFVFPALIDLLTFVPIFLQRGQICRARLRFVQNLLLAGVGLFGVVAGLKANIQAMLRHGGVEDELKHNASETSEGTAQLMMDSFFGEFNNSTNSSSLLMSP